jgi:tetratricopeptide (TPR) repeat protein
VQREKFAEAVPCFEEALKLRPFYPEARTYLGYSLAALGRLEEAAPHFERLVQDIPDSGPARINLGTTLARLGRIDEAATHWIRALELNPTNAGALFETVNVLKQAQAGADAARLLRAVAERFPENSLVAAALIRTLADCDDAPSRAEAASRGRAAVERTKSGEANVLAAAAWAEYRNGDREEAQRLGRQALEIARRRGDGQAAQELERALRQYESPRTP